MWEDSFVDRFFFTAIGTSHEWHYAQHSAIVLPGDRIMLFDNGNNKAKVNTEYVAARDSYSRAVIYQLDTNLMDAYIDDEYGKDFGSEFYSPYISNVEYYGEGHYLVHSGGIASSSIEGALNIPAPLYDGEGTVTMNSITVELLNGTTQYRLEVPSNFYRAKRHSLYNENTSFSLGTPASLGVQEVTRQEIEPIKKKITLFKNVPAKYELDLVKEGDRLRVEGVFDRDDVIYLILKGSDENIVLNIPTSRTAYTAMCTAIFTGDERYITYYIIEQNIYGHFNIYISINGQEYETSTKVQVK
jgi:arylsulfate sulfotransferase